MKQKITLGTLKNRFLGVLGADQLGSLFLKFAMMHLLFNLYTNLQGQYISTLLMRATDGNADIVKFYNMICFAVTGFSMCAASVLVRKFSVTMGTRVGLLFYMLGTGLFLVFMQNLAPVMPLIATINAIGGGFYWIAYCISITAYSEDDTRDKALGFISVICGFVTLVVPMLSGLVLSAFGGSVVGYYIVFGLSCCTALCTLLFSRKLKPLHADDPRSRFGLAVKSVCKDKLWRFAMAEEFFKGAREGTFSFFLNLLLFALISNEAIIGLNTVLASLVSILAASLIGRWVRPGNRIKSMFLSVTITLVGLLAFYLNLSPVTIILFNILNAFISIFFFNPSASIFFMAVQKAPGGQEMQSEIFGIREVILNAGRVSGIIFTMIMPQSTFGNITALCVLTASQYITVFFADRVIKQVRLKEEQENAQLSA